MDTRSTCLKLQTCLFGTPAELHVTRLPPHSDPTTSMVAQRKRGRYGALPLADPSSHAPPPSTPDSLSCPRRAGHSPSIDRTCQRLSRCHTAGRRYRRYNTCDRSTTPLDLVARSHYLAPTASVILRRLSPPRRAGAPSTGASHAMPRRGSSEAPMASTTSRLVHDKLPGYMLMHARWLPSTPAAGYL